MSRFNNRQPVQRTTPITSQHSAQRTGNNAPGATYDRKSELFLLAVSNFVNSDTAYEFGQVRDLRFQQLTQEVAREDPEWLRKFLPWLRREGNMRTAAITAAVEATRQMLIDKTPGGRGLIDSVLLRADEPGEALAYWMGRYGRAIPKPIKRGIADAVQRLYHERSALKYDTASRAIRFGDVLELTHPRPATPLQGLLFQHLIDRRHGREGVPGALTVMSGNSQIRQVAKQNPRALYDPEALAAAGMTWEDTLSLAGPGLDKAKLWEAIIPSMGYMALLRNLRTFDQAGISTEVADKVAFRISDAHEVAMSRQLPMRFLAAYRAVDRNLRWAWALERALQLSLTSLPLFPGSTLILVDTSGSMFKQFSRDGSLYRWDAAAMFGLALAQRCEAPTVVSFGRRIAEFPTEPGESLLPSLERFKRDFFFSGGTPTKEALERFYKGHDRVVVLTDEQADMHSGRGVFDAVPLNKLAVTFNLSGDRVGHDRSGTDTRVTIGGLSDAAFRLLPVLEGRVGGRWPF